MRCLGVLFPRKKQGAKAHKFEVWMPGFHDMGGVRAFTELMGAAEALTFELACCAVMAKHAAPGYWTPANPTVFWGFKLCPSRAEAEALTPEDLRRP